MFPKNNVPMDQKPICLTARYYKNKRLLIQKYTLEVQYFWNVEKSIHDPFRNLTKEVLFAKT